MRLDDWNVKNFREAVEYLRGQDERPFGGRYSSVRRRELPDGTNIVVLHYVQTDIVRFHPDYLVIDCYDPKERKAWRSKTTKDRLNIVLRRLPGNNMIYQEKGTWYFRAGAWSNPNATKFPFYDGLKVGYDGKLVDFDDSRAMDEALRAKELNKKIKRYTDHVKKAIMDGTLQPPPGGDCWICLVEHSSGRTVDNDHLEQHLDEVYVHATLLMNANDESGYRHSIWNALLYEHTQGDGAILFGKKALADHYVRVVRSFFKTRLGVAR